MRKRDWGGIVLGGLLAFAPAVLAAQKAVVIHEGAVVHQLPDLDSEELMVFKRNAPLVVSSGQILDSGQDNWFYKVQIAPQKYGYILASDILTLELHQGFHDAGVGSDDSETVSGEGPWWFLLRGMGIAGLDTASATRFGGEGEFSVCVPFAAQGYFRRMVSIGGAYLSVGSEPVLAGTFIFRIYQESRVEPELRLRLGVGTHTSSMSAGGSFGIAYPFSLYFATHLSGYLEAGALTGLTASSVAVFWGSAGLGLHF